MRGQEAIFLLLLAGLIIVVVALYLRYRKQQLLHQERMAALEKGLPVPSAYTPPAPWSPRVYLLRGLLWTCAGLALSIFLLGVAVSTQRHDSAETIVWRTNNLAHTLNIPAQEARQIVEKDPRHDGMPYGMALMGLIPIAVGVAYLIFYNTGEKKRAELT
jgi:hypothetical protein